MERIFKSSLLDDVKIKSLIQIIIGNLVLALAITQFILPGDITTGGVAGVGIIVSRLVDISPVMIINSLVIIIYLIGALLLGKAFAMKTLLSSVVYPLFIIVIQSINPQGFAINTITNSILGGMMMGLGIGLVLNVDASTGGMDTLALIASKYSGIKSSVCVLTIDSMIVISAFFAQGLKNTIIGILSVMCCSFVIGLVTKKD